MNRQTDGQPISETENQHNEICIFLSTLAQRFVEISHKLHYCCVLMQKLTEDRHTDKRKTHNLLIHNLFWSSTIRAKNEIYMDVPQPSTMMKKALYGPLEYANPELNMEAPYIIRL